MPIETPYAAARPNNAPPSAADAVRYWATDRPGRVAFRLLSNDGAAEELTFAALHDRAGRVAAGLAARVRPGGRVLLLFAQGLDFVVAFVACQMAGLVPVPMSLPRGRERNSRLSLVAGDCSPALILSHKAAERLLAGRDLPAPVVDLADLAAAEAGDPALPACATAFLQYTSGSTGQPRGVIISQANLWANARDIAGAFDVRPTSETVSWLPSYHDMGLVGTILVPIFNGATCNLMAPEDFIRNPMSWLAAISRFGADIAGGPNFALELCAKRLAGDGEVLLPAGLDLSSWRVLFVGAEPVSGATLVQFARAAAPYGFNPGSFLPCYGLAEATLYVAGSRGAPGRLVQAYDTAALQNGRAVPQSAGGEAVRLPSTPLVTCGDAALQGSTRMAIVDPDSRQRLPDGRLGEIWISGPSVSSGYWPGGPESDALFRAEIAGEPGTPWMRTGDIGFIEDGRFCITGRISDMVIRNGVNYFPTDLEYSAAGADPRLPKWRAAAFAVPGSGGERVVVMQEIPREGRRELDLAALAAAIRQAVLDDHGLAPDDVVLLKPGSIPVTASGKVQRRRCREMYLAGEIENLAPPVAAAPPQLAEDRAPPAAEMGETLMTEALRRALASVLNRAVEDIDPRQPMNSFALDSLRVVEVQAYLESRHGLTVIAETLQSATPLYLVATKGAAATDPASFWRDGLFSPPAALPVAAEAPGGILVTGGSGLVGSHLIAALARHAAGPIHCLVRNGAKGSGTERLIRHLRAAGMDDAAIALRVKPIECDLTRPDLGLEAALYDHLAEDIGTIFHNGAELDFLRPYAALKSINVEGTRHILSLAATVRSKRVAHASSVSVLETPVRAGRLLDEATTLDHPETLANGYAQSKWVADLLVTRARDQGIDARIFRPPWILGPQPGGGDSSGFIARFLKTCMILGAVPEGGFGWNMVTPEFVAGAICQAMLGDLPARPVYHLGAAAPSTGIAFRDAFAETGVRLELVPVGDWMARLRRTLAEGLVTPLQPLASLFFQGLDGASAADAYVQGSLPEMDSRATLADLAAAGVVQDMPDLAAFIRHSVLE